MNNLASGIQNPETPNLCTSDWGIVKFILLRIQNQFIQSHA
jgi:hypothetical protein